MILRKRKHKNCFSYKKILPVTWKVLTYDGNIALSDAFSIGHTLFFSVKNVSNSSKRFFFSVQKLYKWPISLSIFSLLHLSSVYDLVPESSVHSFRKRGILGEPSSFCFTSYSTFDYCSHPRTRSYYYWTSYSHFSFHSNRIPHWILQVYHYLCFLSVKRSSPAYHTSIFICSSCSIDHALHMTLFINASPSAVAFNGKLVFPAFHTLITCNITPWAS